MAVPAWPYTAGQRRGGGSVPPDPPRSTDASDRLTTPRRLRLPAWPSGARALCRGRTPPRGFGHGRHPIPPRPDAPRRGGRPRRHAHPSPPDGRGAARARIARRAAGRRLADAHGRARHGAAVAGARARNRGLGLRRPSPRTRAPRPARRRGARPPRQPDRTAAVPALARRAQRRRHGRGRRVDAGAGRARKKRSITASRRPTTAPSSSARS